MNTEEPKISQNAGLIKNTYRKESIDDQIIEVKDNFDYSNYYYKRLTLKKGLNFHNIKFKYCTYDKDGSAVVSEKYCDPGFDYTPGQN